MSTPPSPYKPSPLFSNSTRASPFRRPEPPIAHSPSTIRAATPTPSPLKSTTPSLSPEKPNPLLRTPSSTLAADASWLTTRGAPTTPSEPPSPTRKSSGNSTSGTTTTTTTAKPLNIPDTSNPAPRLSTSTTARPPGPTRTDTSSTLRPLPLRPTPHQNPSDPLANIPPQLLHSMRESFSVLDRQNGGTVGRDDVADMLAQLGLDNSATSLAEFFPRSNGNNSDNGSGGSDSITLPTYLSTLATSLSPLSHPTELLAAFSAFDDDDSGQVDLGELRDALLHVAPEEGGRGLSEREIERVVEGFSARRTFGRAGAGGTKGLGRGEVFRYHDFVAAVVGGGAGNAAGMGGEGPAGVVG